MSEPKVKTIEDAIRLMAESAVDKKDIDVFRNYLEASNGITNLEILKPTDYERAVELFRKDGFIVVGNILNQEQIDILATGCDEVIQEVITLDKNDTGNRGARRYSFGGCSMTRSQLHRPAWQMLLNIKAVTDLLDILFGSQDYILRAASGDFCLPGATAYQPLHSDLGEWRGAKETPYSSYHDPRGQINIRDLPAPYICVNFLPQDVTRLNGPTRQIPGTHNSHAKIPWGDDEPEWMRLSTVCPVPAGSIMIRDTRAWHGGTPNVTDQPRSIPNLEFYAPWFREPIVPGITYQDYKKLPERAQRLARFCVADSSEELDTRTTLRAP